ncbi:PepSY domain-containing protein [Acidovorax sp. GBBC 3334]|uniref:PepSY domain-containing protein n=1 Tax=Acidovorax sp. GBBC 3334 TaxID=2940496 RepID=UPI002302E4C5|nr:PepSY domain-containing protein [Acidovorax sp. GBBC 3334]MDA8453652.1 PepSY domain-containing protein [Acidovorax sp. GBBC 3334]
MARLWPAPRRALYLTHRWLGVAMCAFFAMWFASGMVMMYVGYPQLTDAERLAHLPPLRAGAALLPPAEALARSGLAGLHDLEDLRLAVASGGRPVYLARGAGTGPRGAAVVVDAATGEALRTVDEARALASARAWSGPGAPEPSYGGKLQEDAFTHSRALDAHRPLHRVRLADAAGTVLYVSGTTGEVVRDASRTERAWNYAGAWIHWLYPLRGTALDPYWSTVVDTLSIAGLAAALAGTVAGLLRWRFRGRYRSGARSPYAPGAMRWHHVLGLLFAAATIAWIFSGLMSMNPWRLFDSGAPPLRTEAYRGAAPALPAGAAAPLPALLAGGGPGLRELRWVRTAGRTLVLAYGASPQAMHMADAATGAPAVLESRALQDAIARLVAAPLLRVERIERYDLYHYARAEHTMTGGPARPLPVLRAVFADAHATWVHVDPATGLVLGRLDAHRRVSRWLFALLHSWDWAPLLERRPLWDALLLAGSLGGLALSLTGVAIGARRLRRMHRTRRESKTNRPHAAVFIE